MKWLFPLLVLMLIPPALAVEVAVHEQTLAGGVTNRLRDTTGLTGSEYTRSEEHTV